MKTIDRANLSTSVRGRGLSTRQKQVLELSAQGLSRSNIAGVLDLRYYTVSEHLKQIYRKLGVHNRAAAVPVAMGEGLIEINSSTTEHSMTRPESKVGVLYGDFRVVKSGARNQAAPDNLVADFNLCPCCGHHLSSQTNQ